MFKKLIRFVLAKLAQNEQKKGLPSFYTFLLEGIKSNEEGTTFLKETKEKILDLKGEIRILGRFDGYCRYAFVWQDERDGKVYKSVITDTDGGIFTKFYREYLPGEYDVWDSEIDWSWKGGFFFPSPISEVTGLIEAIENRLKP
jgi:hypothetical protein